MHFEDDNPAGSTDAFREGGIQVNGPGLLNRIERFYGTIGATWLSRALAGTGTIRLYNPRDTKPRIPVLERSFAHPVNQQGLPSEVALCISYRAKRESGQAAARRRGRIFLGPLGGSVSGMGDGASDARPDATALDALLVAFREMAVSSDTNGAFRLAIHSPTALASGVAFDDTFNDATEIYVDNAWDTIRKRGAKATVRRTVAVSGGTAF